VISVSVSGLEHACSLRSRSIAMRKVKSGLDCFSVQMMSKCVAPDFVPQIKSKGFITLLSDMGEVLVWLHCCQIWVKYWFGQQLGSAM
jgi:hypothetical protein